MPITKTVLAYHTLERNLGFRQRDCEELFRNGSLTEVWGIVERNEGPVASLPAAPKEIIYRSISTPFRRLGKTMSSRKNITSTTTLETW